MSSNAVFLKIIRTIAIFFRAPAYAVSHGLGIEKPDDVSRDDDEYDAYRKRMMLAYRFRPNPLVRFSLFKYLISLVAGSLQEIQILIVKTNW